MAKKSDKQKRAVKKLDKAVRKAVDKGVSQTVVENTVEKAIAKAAKKDSAAEAATSTDDDPGTEVVTAKSARMPSGNKQTDVTLKRGVAAPSGKKILNKKPLKADSEKLKKLPGKTKPPTLTRGKN